MKQEGELEINASTSDKEGTWYVSLGWSLYGI